MQPNRESQTKTGVGEEEERGGGRLRENEI